jgi:pyrimidine operon attenuation protein/uracil phosphoribosyltransferase
VHDAAAIREGVEQLTSAIAASAGSGRINVIGIVTRGETLAARIRAKLAERGLDVGTGSVDVTLYRDDLREIGPKAVVRATDLPAEVDGVATWLVDDVIHTGRSVRAALQVIGDFGRPAWVRLAVLVDRGGRELPIQPDLTAMRLDASSRVNVRLQEVDGRDAVEVSA